MINIAGTIGAGKSSLTKIVSDHLNSKAFYEEVKDNPVIELFYQGNKMADEYRKVQGGHMKNPYAFLMQTDFLNKTYDRMRKTKGLVNPVMDRMISENQLFMELNYEMGNVSKVELDVYNDIYENYFTDLYNRSIINARKDIVVYIDVNIDTMISHIKKRGRKFEQPEDDSSLMNYYKTLLDKYNEWIENVPYKVIKIDGNELDYVNNKEDREFVLSKIDEQLRLVNYI